MGLEIASRLRDIRRDRRAQRFQSVELLLRAQLLEEGHAQMLAVQYALEIEQMYFEKRLRVLADRRPRADACSAAQLALRLFQLRLDDEDPGHRRAPAQHDVRRREAERAAEAVAVHDPAAHRIAPAEQQLGAP